MAQKRVGLETFRFLGVSQTALRSRLMMTAVLGELGVVWWDYDEVVLN